MRVLGLFFVCAALLTSAFGAEAAQQKNRSKNGYFDPNRFAALVVDADTGTIIHNEHAHKVRHPASLTKLMTIYLTFEALKQKKINLDTVVTTSANAARQPRINIALKNGEKVSVRNLIDSLAVVSANDSAVVLAEKLGGTEAKFAQIMTERARQLGMKSTTFKNASGLPNPAQVTTAADMAKLMMALKRDFPEYYPLMQKNKFTYKGVPYKSHSSILREYAGVKAGKTGFVNASGFNLVINAQKGQENLVAVVLGGRTAMSRDNYMRGLLDRNFQKLYAYKRSNTPTARAYAQNSKAAQ